MPGGPPEADSESEGRIWKQGARFDIPFRAITPRKEQCENLLVPVCVSASHVAFCAIRLEPTWMHLGEAAGIAASLAAKEGVPVQEIDLEALQTKIKDRGIPLEHPEGPMAYEKHGKVTDHSPDDPVKEFFGQADKDGDGAASKTEWAAINPELAELFPKIDQDNDGKISRAEYGQHEASNGK